MWNKPSINELKNVPDLYSTENVSCKDKLIYLHFFIGNCDWYIAEIDHSDFDLMFGYCILNGDLEMAEWGYVSLSELSEISVRGIEVDRDLYWDVKPFSSIKL
ncbi:DUF2958 domain-containing protein [Candidatus Dependentiae bacterium]|nr:DUF2958 domain-containing protein [Candidatus Dependentiae bacterium]